MYRINVLTSGKFNTAVLGPRYCLTKKTAKSLIKFFSTEEECEIKVEKLTRLYSDVFVWSDDDYEDSVFDYYEKVLCGEEE